MPFRLGLDGGNHFWKGRVAPAGLRDSRAGTAGSSHPVSARGSGAGRSNPKREKEQWTDETHREVWGSRLVAAFAFSAMIASGASAGTYYRCNAHEDGKYSESGCKTLDEKKGKPKGSFELEEVATCVAQKKGKFSDSANATSADVKKGKGKGSFEKATGLGFTAKTGNAKLATPDLGPTDVECSESTTVGELTGAKTDKERVTFTGCHVLWASLPERRSREHTVGRIGRDHHERARQQTRRPRRKSRRLPPVRNRPRVKRGTN